MTVHDIFAFMEWRVECVQYVATRNISRVNHTEIQNMHRNERYEIGTQHI